MYCNKCGQQQEENSKFCRSCSATQGIGQQEEKIAGNSTVSVDRQFYVIPVGKFIFLSIITFGMYELFWFAKNWIMIKNQEKSNIWPIARTIFAIFFFSELATKVLKSAKDKGYSKNYSPIFLAIIYFVSSLLSQAPGNFWLLGFISTLTFVPVLKAVLYNNEKSQNKMNDFEKYKTGEIIAIVLGGIFWVFVLIGLVSRP